MNINKKKLVSIGLPVYNGEPFIQQSLDSLLAQDYENFELIISDNNSEDRTQEICMKYAEQDKRIKYFRCKANNGAFWNFNHVFALSTGKFFMWASHDDYWEPSYISACLKAYEQSPKIILAGTFCESFDTVERKEIFIDRGLTTIGFSSKERLIHYKKILHGGHNVNGIFYGVYKSEFLSKAMPMKKVIANDHLLLLELCLYGEFITIKEKLVHKRWGGASISHKNNARAQGISKNRLILFPYFVREIILQRIIFRDRNLICKEKFNLACWSLLNYFFFSLKLTVQLALGRVKHVWSSFWGRVRR